VGESYHQALTFSSSSGYNIAKKEGENKIFFDVCLSPLFLFFFIAVKK
jgi:hypothetical protein